jgi:hypothetical protein
MQTISDSEPEALTCNMTAIPAANRAAHQEIALNLMFRLSQSTEELADGYAFQFTAGEYELLTQYIANERLCCPFFKFELEILPQRGPIWLRVRGDETVKTFLATEFAQYGGQ